MGGLSSEKQDQICGFLGQLPEGVARRLAKAIEVDRLIGGKALPHDLILKGLRPQLRRAAGPERMGTPLRYFCRPFADLLASDEREVKQKGRIARSSIAAVWNWLAKDLMRERHAELGRAVSDAIVKDDSVAAEAAAATLAYEASAVIAEAIAADPAKAAKALGGALAMEDAAEIAALLGASNAISAIQRRLRKPHLTLSEDDLNFLREIFDRATQENGDLGPYIGLIVMARLARPWEALRFAAAVSHSTNDAMIANTDMGIVGDILFDDLDGYVRKIQAARLSDVDTDSVIADLENFSDLSTGVVKELGIRRDGKWGLRLAKARGQVATTLENLIKRAPREMMTGLPSAKGGVFARGPKANEMTQPVDPERVARATRYARLMVKAKPFAAAAAFNAKLGEALDEAAESLRNYSEDLLRELRTDDPAARAEVEKHFAFLLDLYTMILGVEEASFLRRRARIQAQS